LPFVSEPVSEPASAEGSAQKRFGWGNVTDFASGFVDVKKEIHDVKMSLRRGSLPPELRGTLFRNGPGLHERDGQSVQHPFDGDGLVVAMRFTDDGVMFSNKFVRTKTWQEEEAAGQWLYRGVFGTKKPGGVLANAFDLRLKNVANTNVVQLGDQLLALCESGGPHALDPCSLDTLGLSTLDGALKLDEKFSAHPRFDPGHHGAPRMVAFGVEAGPTSTIRLMEFATKGPDAGRLISDRKDSFPGFCFMHDFAITPNWAIFLQPAIDLDPLPFLFGLKGAAQTVKERPGAKSKFILIPRECGDFAGQAPRIVDAPDGFVFHHSNAWESTSPLDVVVESIYYDEFPQIPPDQDFRELDFEKYPGGTLQRCRINLVEGAHSCNKLVSRRSGEFPMVNPRYEGLPARNVWMAVTEVESDNGYQNGPLQAIMKADLVTGDQLLWRSATRSFVTEPLMVPRPGTDAQDDGWVLVLVWNGARSSTDLVVLNANDMSEQAVLELPLAIPYGLHGSWVQNTDSTPAAAFATATAASATGAR
jgi:all-trans-8'-apo-beta-carotenal 15,15'-oxygenase